MGSGGKAYGSMRGIISAPGVLLVFSSHSSGRRGVVLLWRGDAIPHRAHALVERLDRAKARIIALDIIHNFTATEGTTTANLDIDT
jgi:hypothetical protein